MGRVPVADYIAATGSLVMVGWWGVVGGVVGVEHMHQ